MHILDLLEATATEIYDSEDDIVEKMRAIAAQARTEKKVLGTHRYVKVLKPQRLWSFDVTIFGEPLERKRMDLTAMYHSDDPDDTFGAEFKKKIADTRNSKKKVPTKYQAAAYKFLTLVKDNDHGWEFVGWDYGTSGTVSLDNLFMVPELEEMNPNQMKQGTEMRVFFKLDPK